MVRQTQISRNGSLTGVRQPRSCLQNPVSDLTFLISVQLGYIQDEVLRVQR